MLFVSDNKQALEKEMWEYRQGMLYNHSQIRTQANSLNILFSLNMRMCAYM